ncbi:hypothetical protein PRVXH_002098 [Proteinivorax hydrogeniformans]|uniref:Lipoprotein n=1 Tax=Proteinivorax hydrogeniformans TaxID=1826727 RepID=A0AAU8HSK7_9FIRM
MKVKKVILMVLILTFLMLLTGCVPGDGSYTTEEPAGFFWGIWHGWIAPISLIIGLFNEGIRIYEPINTGLAYDFGFYLAVIGGFGGISFTRKQYRQ